jgi:hypothetical protein
VLVKKFVEYLRATMVVQDHNPGIGEA